MAGEAPEQVLLPIWTESPHRIDVNYYTDETLATRKDMSGKTCTVLIDDNGTTRTYALSWDAQATGQGYITLVDGSHDNASTGEEVQAVVNDVVKKEFTIEVKTRLT